MPASLGAKAIAELWKHAEGRNRIPIKRPTVNERFRRSKTNDVGRKILIFRHEVSKRVVMEMQTIMDVPQVLLPGQFVLKLPQRLADFGGP